MAKNKVTDALAEGEQFSMVGNTDGVKRVYTCLKRTVADFILNGTPAHVQNVVARNQDTGKRTVFALSSLVNVASKV